jgi:hypothetical protein
MALMTPKMGPAKLSGRRRRTGFGCDVVDVVATTTLWTLSFMATIDRATSMEDCPWCRCNRVEGLGNFPRLLERDSSSSTGTGSSGDAIGFSAATTGQCVVQATQLHRTTIKVVATVVATAAASMADQKGVLWPSSARPNKRHHPLAFGIPNVSHVQEWLEDTLYP